MLHAYNRQPLSREKDQSLIHTRHGCISEAPCKVKEAVIRGRVLCNSIYVKLRRMNL